MSAIARIETGVEVIHGLMGAGKSFFAVRRCVREILATRRPLYTNLPLKFPVVRRYLGVKGGAECTNLIRRLDQQHWRAFLQRQHAYANFREGLKKSRPDDLDPERFASFHAAVGGSEAQLRRLAKFTDSQLAAWFQALNGPHIMDGPDANWIPPTSIICIDEVQHWHPMTRQKDDKNREDLLAYLTMIRHHCQWLWVITQDTGRIAIEFRLLAKYFWRVWDRGEDRLAWGIRYKHFGVRAMGYEKATPDQLEGSDPDNRRPSERFTIIAKFPWNRVIFRLYSSHTNIGSPRQMLRELRQARAAAGLAESGKSQQEIEAMTKAPEKPSFKRRTLRFARRTATLALVGLVAFAAGGGFAEAPPPEDTTLADEPVTEPAPLPPIAEWPRWAGVGSLPFIAGRRAEAGQMLTPRIRLDYIEPGGRSLVLRVDDREWWLWRWPDREPTFVGQIEDVRAAVQRLEIDAPGDPGAPVQRSSE